MYLSDMINKNLILLNLNSKEKKTIIEEIAGLFYQEKVIKDKNSFVDAIKKREGIESTAIGEGVAIPHGKSEGVKELKVAFARSSEGVDFKSLDKKSVHLIFMIAAPLAAKVEYLQCVAKIARLLKSKSLKEKLLSAENSKEVMNIIKSFDKQLPEKLAVKTKEGRVIHK